MNSTTVPEPRNSSSARIDFSSTSDDAFLGGAIRLYQPKTGYRAGTDALLLAATVPNDSWTGSIAKHDSSKADHFAPVRVLDVGSGIGTVGMCVAKRVRRAQVTLIEKNPDLVAIALENRRRNDFDVRIEIIAADICSKAATVAAAGLARKEYDYVLANPPFHMLGHGIAPKSEIKADAHTMSENDLELWLLFMTRMCAQGGTATLIHKAGALDRLLSAMRGRFGALRVLPLHPRLGMAANRVIVTGIKGSKAEMKICPGLIIHTEGNRFTQTVDAIFRNGAGLEIPS